MSIAYSPAMKLVLWGLGLVFQFPFVFLFCAFLMGPCPRGDNGFPQTLFGFSILGLLLGMLLVLGGIVSAVSDRLHRRDKI